MTKSRTESGGAGTGKAGSEAAGPWRPAAGVPPVRAATRDDLAEALAAGWRDFRAMPALGLAIGALYMIGGWLLIAVIEARDYRGLTFPVVAGFTLIGPFAATILYEMSRRRERGLGFGIADAGDMIRGTARRQILYLGFVLMFWLAVWSRIAVMLFAIHFSAQPDRLLDLVGQFLTTGHGISFLVVGHAFGAFFAAVAFCLSVVAFPFLLDRDADVITAIVTSFKTVLASPAVMLGWGAFIGVAMALASLPAFLLMPLALPVLGHASWHLYRRLVEE